MHIAQHYCTAHSPEIRSSLTPRYFPSNHEYPEVLFPIICGWDSGSTNNNHSSS